MFHVKHNRNKKAPALDAEASMEDGMVAEETYAIMSRQIEVMREALEPFAKCAEAYEDDPEDMEIYRSRRHLVDILTVGQFRKARAALQQDIVQRLRQEIEVLRDKLADTKAHSDVRLSEENDALIDQIEALRTENAGLRAIKNPGTERRGPIELRDT